METNIKPNLSPIKLFSLVIPIFSSFLLMLKDIPHFYGVAFAMLVSGVSYWILIYLFPTFYRLLFRNASKIGYDLCKKPQNYETTKSPPPVEPIGIFVSIAYLLIVVYMQGFFIEDTTKMMEYNAGLFTICFVSLIGYADDTLKLAWRYKILTPLIGCVPMLFTYQGSTSIILPSFISNTFGISLVNLFYFYHLLMLSSIIFYCNAINILAGINGLEVGQSLILSFFIMIYNIIEISNQKSVTLEFPKFNSNDILYQNVLSLYLSIPFFCCSLATLVFNWKPSRYFVGDAYTYFAGAHFAVVAIMGHSIRTFVLFSTPQIINFLMSLPQLLPSFFGKYARRCPNHRLPHLDRIHEPYLQISRIPNRLFVITTKQRDLLLEQINNTKHFEDEEHKNEWSFRKSELENLHSTGQIYPLYYEFHPSETYYSVASKGEEKVPVMLTPKQVKSSKINLTLICFMLKIFGPMKEDNLVIVLLLFQVFCGVLGLLLRYSPFYTMFLSYKM